jgi:hypothetical protein
MNPCAFTLIHDSSLLFYTEGEKGSRRNAEKIPVSDTKQSIAVCTVKDSSQAAIKSFLPALIILFLPYQYNIHLYLIISIP